MVVGLKHSRLVIVAALSFILCLPGLLAVSTFDVEVTPVTYHIYPNETAVFNITFANNVNIIENFEISSPDAATWDIYTIPRKDYVVEVFPNKERTVTVYLKPLYVEQGIYNLRLTLSAQRQEQRITEEIEVDIKNPTPGHMKYVPSLTAELDVPSVVHPKDLVEVKLLLRNLVPIELSGLRVSINGEGIDQSQTLTLKPLEERIIQFSTVLDPKIPPQERSLRGEVIYIDEENKSYIFQIDKEDYEIKSYSTFVTKPSAERGFLTSRITLEVFNDGNIAGMQVLTQPALFLDGLFAKISPEASIEESADGKVYTWSVVLNPMEGHRITIKRNYLPLLIIFLVLVAIIVIYFAIRSPVVLFKTAAIVRGDEDGITEIKVTLFLKNRSAVPVDEIKLVDRIPHIIEVEKDFKMGTIKPDKIVRKSSKATRIIWNIAALEGYEERIVTYKINSKLSIVGGLTLPSSYVKFVKPNGNKSIRVSNSYVLRQ
ncbi:MAG: hypothetical protein ABIC95_01895 [archaeon]